MESSISNNKVKMFFFPYIAGGHLLPMIDTARFFASCHPNVQVTIITTPQITELFQSSINRDCKSGHEISFCTLELPNKAQLADAKNFLATLSVDQRTKIVTAVENLRDPLQQLLVSFRPDCLVSDLMHSWTLDIANETGIPWIVFHFSSLFSLCVEDSLVKFKPHHNVGSDTDLFLLDGITHRVKFTKSRLPYWHRSDDDAFVPINLIRKVCEKSYAMIVNSCSGFEGDYRSHAQIALRTRVCMVGPASLNSTRNIEDIKVQTQTLDSDSILNWLNSKETKSVVYLCFGTEANFCKAQFHEIAYGLESSGQPFIWVGKPNLYQDQGEEGWFPEGFEARIRDSKQGILIKGWAPQLVILGHPNLGVFVTHCGWSSFQEGLCNEVAMITWPITHDHFYIESLMVDVLKVGIRVGNEEWMFDNAPPKVTVTREKLEEALRRVMNDGEEVVEIRRNAKDYAEKCKMAVQQGGASFQDAYRLVEELKSRKEELGKRLGQLNEDIDL